jgi:hypothetical protein
VIRRRVTVAALAAVLLATCVQWARAQAPAPALIVPAERLGFLTRLNYHFELEGYSGSDSAFRGSGRFGGDFDFVGGPKGRANAAFDYEAVLGDELQPFDPNQGNYIIEVLGAGRVGEFEIAGLFHHTSRHLGDRFKDYGIAWNLLGPQCAWTRIGPVHAFQLQARALKALTHDAVDYSAEFSTDFLYRRRVRPRWSIVARGRALARTIDPSLSSRGTQAGGRGEFAFRIHGRRADLELYAGGERRIEAGALDPRPHTWALAGARLVSPE